MPWWDPNCRVWEDDEDPPPCACEDTGWMEDQDGNIVPCCECSQPVTLEDDLFDMWDGVSP